MSDLMLDGEHMAERCVVVALAYDQGLRNAKHLAAQLDKSYAGAAASLREGLEE